VHSKQNLAAAALTAGMNPASSGEWLTGELHLVRY
jgi:hypothetical protein